MAPTERRTIRRLVGVYDANGTVGGELAYWIGARLGRTHCALCEVTHGLVGERAAWRTCRDGLPVVFDTYHRNDQPDAVRAAAMGEAPIVFAETADGLVRLLGSTDLDACDGIPERLEAAIEKAIRIQQLEW